MRESQQLRRHRITIARRGGIAQRRDERIGLGVVFLEGGLAPATALDVRCDPCEGRRIEVADREAAQFVLARTVRRAHEQLPAHTVLVHTAVILTRESYTRVSRGHSRAGGAH